MQKADKKIKRVDVIDDDPISAYNLVRPGKPLSDKDLERMVLQAEGEKTIPIQLAMEETAAYIKLKKKQKRNGTR